MKLSGGKIRLRAIEPEDIEILYRWENDESIWNVSNTLIPFSKNTLMAYLANAHLDVFTIKQVRFVVEIIETKQGIGFIDIFDFDPLHLRAEIGILIAETSQRNKGYAVEAIKIMSSYCFETLHIHQLYCTIEMNNFASIKAFKRAKFTSSGIIRDWQRKDNGWNDAYFMQLLNS